MPIYEYRCRKCSAVSEFFSKGAADKPSSCKECGSADLEKILSAHNALKGDHSHSACDSCGIGDSCGSAGMGCGMPPCHR